MHDPQTAAAQAKTGTQDPADRQGARPISVIRSSPNCSRRLTPQSSKSGTHPTIRPIKKFDQLNAAHKLKALPFPAPRGLPEPQLSLADILGASADSVNHLVKQKGQLVFHATGDTGNTRGPGDQNLVADKMISDFSEDEVHKPLFFFHLGDVIYSFGEGQYYYDQFYEPYRNYPAPIVALAGNHDGMVAPGTNASTLTAFLENFCSGAI